MSSSTPTGEGEVRNTCSCCPKPYPRCMFPPKLSSYAHGWRFMCLQRRERLPRSHSVAPLDGGHPANLHGALPRRRVEHPPAQHAAPAGLARSLGGVSRIHGSDSVSPRRYARLQLFCYLNSWRLWTTRRAASERLNITHFLLRKRMRARHLELHAPSVQEKEGATAPRVTNSPTGVGAWGLRQQWRL